MKPILPVIALSLATVGGCATPAAQSDQAGSVPSPASSIIQSDAELMTQRLAPGECGLFLWSRNDMNRFIFFARAGTGNAIFMFNDAERNLSQTGIRGEIFGQFLTEMSYQDTASDLAVTVTVEPGEQIEGGQKVSAGKITVKDHEGWEVILPIAGTRACINRN